MSELGLLPDFLRYCGIQIDEGVIQESFLEPSSENGACAGKIYGRMDAFTYAIDCVIQAQYEKKAGILITGLARGINRECEADDPFAHAYIKAWKEGVNEASQYWRHLLHNHS